MIRTGLEKSGLFYCAARSFLCIAAVMILLGSVGCSNRIVRKSRALQPEAPEAAVSEAAAPKSKQRSSRRDAFESTW